MLTFLLNLLAQAAGILVEASIYLLFGFFVAGLIHAYFPEDKILKYFGGRNLRSVFNASLLGIPLPLCSCSVIPTAVQLRKSGASRGATLSFLVSTPETGVDSIGISFALLDPLMSIFRPISALITALTAGIGANFLEKRSSLESLSANSNVAPAPACMDDCCTPAAAKPQSPLRRALSYSFGELLDDLAPWLVIGILVAALIAVIIPEDFFAGVLGSGFLPMLIMMLIGIPLYICASASTPIAAALILKGLSPGAALVFLLTGPATNIGSLILLLRYFERKFLALYIATIAVMSLLLGALLNFIYNSLNLDVRATLGAGSEIIPSWLKIIAALGTALLLHRSLLRGGSYRKLWNGLTGKFGLSKRRLLTWLGFALALIYLSDSLTTVPAGYTGMISSFGKVVQQNLEPGLHLRAPRPFAHTVLYPSERIEVVQIGYRLVSTADAASIKNGKGEKFDAISRENRPEESELLAGDENLIDLDVSIFYCVSDARQALYQIADFEKLLQELSSAELTRQIASRPVWDGLIGGKEDFVGSLKLGLQKTLDEMAIGVKILHVNLIYAHAPDVVHSAFREVASSLEDKYRLINLAQTDSVAALANARAQFAAALSSARADSARALADAGGQAGRLTVLAKSTAAHRRLQQFRMNAEAAESTLVGREKILMLGQNAAALDLILIPKSSGPAQELPPEVLERLKSSLNGP